MSMMKLSVFAVAMLAMFSQTAAAESVHVLPTSGWVFIGQVDGHSVVMVSRDAGATCVHSRRLAEAGLTDNWHIVAASTLASNFFHAVDTPINFCGTTVTPLATNGHTVTVVGGGGPDIIDGGLTVSVMFGMGGNDYITGRRSPTAMVGGAGNDVLIASNFNSGILGETGDDTACVNNAARAIRVMDGGPQNTSSPGDRRCGVGTEIMQGWETSTCAPCQ